MKKYVVTVCQEVKYMIVCAALLLAFFTTVNAAEKEAPEKIIRVGTLGDTFNYVTENGMRKGYSYELLLHDLSGPSVHQSMPNGKEP